MSTHVQFVPAHSPSVPLSGPVCDTFGRRHSDLRISLTDRCNIRCFYCMPEMGGPFSSPKDLLTFGQLVRLAEAACSLGFDKIRLTGGEPLLRPKLPDLVASLSPLHGLRDLALTTNAVLLGQFARPLHEAGLRRLNVHLDTVDPDRFKLITRRDDLGRVLAGIDEAVALGYTVKLNAVAIKGLTEPDLVPLVRFGFERGIQVRFIEFMPLDSQHLWSLDRVLTAADMIRTLSDELGPLTPVRNGNDSAPASEYRLPGGERVGIIASVSQPFCANCNRLRATADGKLRYCLFAREETDIRPLFDREDASAALESAIRATVWGKWAGHEIGRSTFVPPPRPMYSIGG